MAALEAFQSPESDAAVDAMVADFRGRRDLLVDGLNRIPGITCRRPAGAFYVFPDITATGLGERELQTGLLEEVGVAVLAGTAFGPHGAGHIRLSYANSSANLQRALERIALHVGAGAVPPA
jgi:aspartate/methionine/tyrosine aminotransferase